LIRRPSDAKAALADALPMKKTGARGKQGRAQEEIVPAASPCCAGREIEGVSKGLEVGKRVGEGNQTFQCSRGQSRRSSAPALSGEIQTHRTKSP